MNGESGRIIDMEGQMKIFKSLAGGAFTISLILGGWVFTQGVETAEVKREIVFQQKLGDKRDVVIAENSKKGNQIERAVGIFGNEIKNVNKSLDEIKTLIKEMSKK